jgi:hypothetical protein
MSKWARFCGGWKALGVAVAKVDAGVVVGVEGQALEGIAADVIDPLIRDLHASVDVLAIEVREHRRRRRAVEAIVVIEDLQGTHGDGLRSAWT